MAKWAVAPLELCSSESVSVFRDQITVAATRLADEPAQFRCHLETLDRRLGDDCRSLTVGVALVEATLLSRNLLSYVQALQFMPKGAAAENEEPANGPHGDKSDRDGKKKGGKKKGDKKKPAATIGKKATGPGVTEHGNYAGKKGGNDHNPEKCRQFAAGACTREKCRFSHK